MTRGKRAQGSRSEGEGVGRVFVNLSLARVQDERAGRRSGDCGHSLSSCRDRFQEEPTISVEGWGEKSPTCPMPLLSIILPMSSPHRTHAKHRAVAPGEPGFFSKSSPVSLLTAALRRKPANTGHFAGCRLWVSRVVRLGPQPRASSTSPEGVSHGLRGRFSELVNGRARSGAQAGHLSKPRARER